MKSMCLASLPDSCHLERENTEAMEPEKIPLETKKCDTGKIMPSYEFTGYILHWFLDFMEGNSYVSAERVTPHPLVWYEIVDLNLKM